MGQTDNLSLHVEQVSDFFAANGMIEAQADQTIRRLEGVCDGKLSIPDHLIHPDFQALYQDSLHDFVERDFKSAKTRAFKGIQDLDGKWANYPQGFVALRELSAKDNNLNLLDTYFPRQSYLKDAQSLNDGPRRRQRILELMAVAKVMRLYQKGEISSENGEQINARIRGYMQDPKNQSLAQLVSNIYGVEKTLVKWKSSPPDTAEAQSRTSQISEWRKNL